MREVDADLDYYESVYKRLVAEVGEALDDFVTHRQKLEARGNRARKSAASKQPAEGEGGDSFDPSQLQQLVESGRVSRADAEAFILGQEKQ